MIRFWDTVAFRLALGYGLLAIGSMSVIAAAFYFGTVGVLARSTDAKLISISNRLSDHYETRGGEAVRQEVQQLLVDGIEQDTEVYLLVAPDGRRVAGNIYGWTMKAAPLGSLTDLAVMRNGRPSLSRLLPQLLPDGSILVVGRDMQDQREIERLVWHALLVGGAVALLLVIGGALLFRRQLEHRVGAIRHTALEIEAGDLSRRIPVSDVEDEFARLNRDINRMLDRIEHLMDGVRHVSNAIAHDLRTPLGRIRSRLEEALRPGNSTAQLDGTARFAIQQVDELIRMLDRLLQIAEAESGAHRQYFAPVSLAAVVSDVVELYDATAEAEGITLVSEIDGRPTTLGDKNLLTSALVNLTDNALKYAGTGATVRVRAKQDQDTVSMIVQDDGPGIPPAERSRVTERFYRLDQSRSLPGNGLGLSIVAATASLHWGKLDLEDAAPGLIARIVLPRADVVVTRRENLPEPLPVGTIG
ncbi:MAG TPA: HAMP domain-containing sensor histidine kinase [Stellaceae bacterium]|jgi:signal transduction histidine kinase|nr:HAMP domain-containing sensor histidine kinase [Stellaceae bacterium]